MRAIRKTIVLSAVVSGLTSCLFVIENKQEEELTSTDTSAAIVVDTAKQHTLSQIDSFRRIKVVNRDSAASPLSAIDTKNVNPDELVRFAETLIGIPYKYASTDPAAGFDCSGFITYVFNHFNIQVPRSSVDFTNVGRSIPVANAKRGDLILFTGTDSLERAVGHMGIVVSNAHDSLHFIHSTSGKAYGVTITPLNDYYKGRYVKTIRIFKQNDS